MTNDAPARMGRIRSATIDCFPPNGVPYPKFLVRGSSWRVFDGHALRARITEKLLVSGTTAAETRHAAVGVARKSGYSSAPDATQGAPSA